MPTQGSSTHLPDAAAKTAFWLRKSSEQLLQGNADDEEDMRFEMERVVQHLDAISGQSASGRQTKYDMQSLVRTLKPLRITRFSGKYSGKLAKNPSSKKLIFLLQSVLGVSRTLHV